VYLARIYVTLKPTVNDPQGQTILGGLKNLRFGAVAQVRAGKYLEVRLEAPTRPEAEGMVTEMCRKLLANPVIEEFRFDLEELSAVSGQQSASS
jgi:phosphoribosylformylglycinamidine synthase